MPMKHIRLGNRKINLPRSRVARLVIGIALVIGGVVGFLPILGFWMIPLGLLVLSVDLPVVRRWRRELGVRLGRWLKELKEKYPALWRRFES
jgi:hypothetical protein